MRKILVFETDHLSIQAFHSVIKDGVQGLEVMIRQPDESSLARCLEELPDVIFLDTYLTGMHGLELCAQIKENPQLKGTPLVALSVRKGGNKNALAALGAGADAFLYKPLHPAELRASLKLMLRLKALEGAISDTDKSLIDRYHTLEARFEEILSTRKQTEEKLLIERDFANQVLNAMGQGLTITNSDGIFQYVNPSFARMLGYDSQELIGKRPRDLAVDDALPVLEEARKIRFSGKMNSYEMKMLHKSGKEIPLMVTGVPYYRAGQIAGAIAVATDISSLKETEEELKRISKEYEQIFNSTQDAMFLVKVFADATFKYVRTNKSHQDKTGFKHSHIAGKTPVELLGVEIGAIVENNYKECLDKKSPIRYQEFLDLPGGKRYWETTLNPVIVRGRVAYIVGSSTDITRFKQMEEALESLRKNNNRE